MSGRYFGVYLRRKKNEIAKIWEKLGKFQENLGKSGKKWEKVGKSGKSWEKVGKVGKIWENLGKWEKKWKISEKKWYLTILCHLFSIISIKMK